MSDSGSLTPTEDPATGGLAGQTHVNPDTYIRTADLDNISSQMTSTRSTMDDPDDNTLEGERTPSDIRATEAALERFIFLVNTKVDPLDDEIISNLLKLCEMSHDTAHHLVRKYELLISRVKEDYIVVMAPILAATRLGIPALECAIDSAIIGYQAAAAKRFKELFSDLGLMAAEFRAVIDLYVGQAEHFQTTVSHAAVTWNRVSSSTTSYAAHLDEKHLMSANSGTTKHVRSASPASHTSMSSPRRFLDNTLDFISGYAYKCNLGVLEIDDESMVYNPSGAQGSHISSLLTAGMGRELVKRLLLLDLSELINYIQKHDPNMQKFKVSQKATRRAFMDDLLATVPIGHRQ